MYMAYMNSTFTAEEFTLNSNEPTGKQFTLST